MIVYRLAHSEVVDSRVHLHCGPYGILTYMDAWGSESKRFHQFQRLQDTFCRATRDADHPTPWVDSALMGIQSSEVCGFDSLESLKKWFGDYLEMFMEIGFEIQAFDVPDECARVGHVGQVVFESHAAQRVVSA